MGEGSFERIMALGIPLDQLDKVFLGHLHLDHAGDFPAFYFTGPVNNRLTPLRLWGPSGVRPEWGTKTWVERRCRSSGPGRKAGRGSAVDPRGLQLEVNEFDWMAVNNVIYDERGVQIRTLPAIHLDQSVSFLLDWNGLRFAFSSDTLPNRWWREHATGADLSIHECFIPPQMMMERYGMTPVRGRLRRHPGAHCGAGLRQDHVAHEAQARGLLPLPERLRHADRRGRGDPQDLRRGPWIWPSIS